MTPVLTNKRRWAPKPLLKDNESPAFLESCLLDMKKWLYDLPQNSESIVQMASPTHTPFT